jgi:uncharacterized RDD family membrane protein YckC
MFQTSTQLPLASRWTRLFGQCIDGIIGAVPLCAGVAVMSFSDALGGLIALAGLGWSFYYYLFADGFQNGQSFAKRWLGIQVIDAQSGAPCTFKQSFIRNLLLALLGPIDWIFIFGERHQRLGDKAAGTVVVAD